MEQQNLFEEQPRATVVHLNKKPFDVLIARPSIWGNPYSHKDDTVAEFKVKTKKEAIDKYREYLLLNKELMSKLPELKGKVLGCWCKDWQGRGTCHGDVLAELANKL
jgi:hypothetical protein